MSKKKKGFKGSSGFLNAVSKMFGGGSKKGSDKSRSFSVSEKELKKVNDTSVKQGKKPDVKNSKTDTKSDSKALKAEQKAEAKLNKSMQKALKKEAKLNKSVKGKANVDLEDLSSSTSSLKKSAEDLIDIDKSDDDEVFCSQNKNLTIPQAGSVKSHKKSESKTNNSVTSPKTPEMKKALLVSNSLQESESQLCSNVPCSNANKSNSATISANMVVQSQSEHDKVPAVGKISPNAHLTKTEMLLARRQRQLSVSHDQTEDDVDEDSAGKRKCIITTV